MKKAKLILPIVALCTLSSCGTKTTLEKFMEEVNKIEDHTYKTITVNYSSEKDDEKVEAKITYTVEEGLLKPDVKNSYSSRLELYCYQSVQFAEYYDKYFDSDEQEIKNKDENAKIESEILFYVKPFKIVGSFKGTFKNENCSGKKTIDFEYEFNKYGYLTCLESSSSYNYTEKQEDTKTTTSSKTHQKVTLSYKD